MTEDIMNEIENSMVTGLQFEESYPEPEEQEFDKSEHPDPSLNDTLTDIARLQAITNDIEALVESIGNSTLGRKQA
jgi:hypothetical protein